MEMRTVKHIEIRHVRYNSDGTAKSYDYHTPPDTTHFGIYERYDNWQGALLLEHVADYPTYNMAKRRANALAAKLKLPILDFRWVK